MKQRNILFVSHISIMAGANHSLLQLMIELRDNYKISPIVVGPRIGELEKYNILQACKDNEIPYIACDLMWFKYKENSFRLKIIYVIKSLLTLCRMYFKIRPLNVSLIHTNSSVVSIGVFLAKLLNVPHVFHLREFGDLDYGLRSFMGVAHDRFVYNQSKACIAISCAIKNHYQDIIDKRKIRVIYNGISKRRFSLVSEHLNEKVNFCVLGIVNETKNQKSAIDAVYNLIRNGYNKFHLYIIGADNSKYAEVLKEYVKSNNLNDFISFLGEIKNVPEVLSQMDVGLMLSSNEAFGRVTIEYMMQNIAVIASNRGANMELIIHKDTGLIYDYDSIDDLVKSMSYLIDNRNVLMDYARRGRNFALNRFSSEKNSDEIFKLYRELWHDDDKSTYYPFNMK